MYEYKPETPRAAIAAGAAALVVATFGALVAAPALLDARDDAPALLAAAQREATVGAVQVAVVPAPAAPTEVDIVPGRVEVVATRGDLREPSLAWSAVGTFGLAATLPAIEAPSPATMNVSWALPSGGPGAPCRPQV